MRAEERELSMEKAIAVKTCLGVLKGRDCIYLDQMKRDDPVSYTHLTLPTNSRV